MRNPIMMLRPDPAPFSPDTRRTAHTNSPPQELILFAKVIAVKAG
jgi:hypothetical protein